MNKVEKLERLIAKFIKGSVILTSLLLITSLALSFRFESNTFFNFQTYDPIPLIDLLRYYLKNNDWGALVSYAGLFILLLTPFIRVFITTVGFLWRKEFLLSLASFLILTGLLTGLFLGTQSH